MPFRFKRAMKNLPEEEQIEVGRSMGRAYALRAADIGSLPVAKGVGRVERLKVSHGGNISLVHPVSINRKKKHPLNFPSLSSR